MSLSITRSTALFGLTLSLCGCGNTWWNPPLTGGYNPNLPVGDSDNMLRVMGRDTPTAALRTEPGDIWPGPLPPSPTLQDMENQTGIGSAGQQPDYSTDMGNSPAPSLPSPNPARGSSTPPPAPPPPMATARPPAPSATVQPPAARDPSGQVYQTGKGPVVTNGGGAGYQTTTTPGGGSAIIVPNGNGTSTVIHSDGRVETVTTPK